MKKNKYIFQRMQEFNSYNSKIDMHMHTDWTDGNNTLLEMVDQAIRNRLNMVAITDHIREQSEYFSDYINEINIIQNDSNIKIYSGFEAKILDMYGNIDISQKALSMADIIIASVHRIPYGGKYHLPKELSYERLADLELKLALSVIKKRKINVIGHSGGMSISAYGQFPEEYFEKIISECAVNDVAFEFNYKYHQVYEGILRKMLFKYNPYVSVGSDAHEAGKISSRSFCNNEI